MKTFRFYTHWIFLVTSCLLIAGCGNDDAPPPEENEEELIDRVTLTFAPTTGTAIEVLATDPDGDGVEEIAPDGPINLIAGEEYTLTLKLENTLEGEDITEEIQEEDEEHMFFFSFSTDVFSSPAGNGNVDNRSDDVNYNDEDSNGFPIGLSTTWTAGSVSPDGTFRVILKHQPDIKTATSTADDGESDIDITWALNITN